MTWVALPVLSLVVSFALSRRFVRGAGPTCIDEPNARSLHDVPVPKTGGVAVMAAVAAAGVLSGDLLIPLGLAVALALISFADDSVGVPVVLRLALHVTAACAVSLWALHGHGTATWLLAALLVAWATNLYNFMDGMDGFAPGMAVVGFGAYATVAVLHHDDSVALLCVVVCTAALGFLAFNFPPAHIFLGDTGSIPLGFLAGAIGVVGWGRALWPAWFPLVVFGPFVIDATVTLARRAWRRERVWEAHRQHYYQRLVRTGWSHRRVVLCEYAVIALSAGVAYGATKAGPMLSTVLVAGIVVVYLCLMVVIDRLWSQTSTAVVMDGGPLLHEAL